MKPPVTDAGALAFLIVYATLTTCVTTALVIAAVAVGRLLS